ncbi:ribosomal RNA-processing protein 8-like [Amphibalanus amphitrite]|uniref:ribosomal RNA-processing protein 8-like n=1 Tax=Amphibalanus amphitrite TaxID=1232801 RepID=UPI001C8FE2AD|nr:ribosomal RNA-processing protein 8-like [Amphibalanus amphitrite]XP_043246703.1 ribosomal RNA-processing protein 8-like [Amphibalanus amphitrite]XP_043246704.1 ribosomal RNA-processing protein 8-like [Amphibalanus amphitrite]
MKVKKGKASKIGPSKKPLKHNAPKIFKTKKQKGKKRSKKSSQAPVVKSVVPVEASGRVNEILSHIHQLKPARPVAQSAAAPSSPSAPSPSPAAAPPPLKKPRAERQAFLPPPVPEDAGDGSDADGDPEPPTAARGKKKRRKMKLAKRKLRREELLAAAETPEAKLESARFRYLNEQLYTRTGFEALKMFSRDRESFDAYHQGFRNQVAKWPVNPLDLIIKNVNKMPPSHLVVDLGCGDARLATSVRQRVLSYDLVATNERVTACDMAHLPLEDGAANVAVLCLALMGTNLVDFVMETNRILKMGGQLRIAEVASRFDSVDDFVKSLQAYGFHFISQDLSHKYFYMFSLKKVANVDRKRRKELPEITLKPCLYKRR